MKLNLICVLVIMATSTFARAEKQQCELTAVRIDNQLNCGVSSPCNYKPFREQGFSAALSQSQIKQIFSDRLSGNGWDNYTDNMAGTTSGALAAAIYRNSSDERFPKGYVMSVLDSNTLTYLADILLPADTASLYIHQATISFTEDNKHVVLGIGFVNRDQHPQAPKTYVFNLQQKSVAAFDALLSYLENDFFYGITGRDDSVSYPNISKIDLNSLQQSVIVRGVDFVYIWPRAGVMTGSFGTYSLPSHQLLSGNGTSSYLFSSDGSNLLYYQKNEDVETYYKVGIQNVCAPIATINAELKNKSLIFNDKSCKFEGAGDHVQILNDLLNKATLSKLSLNDSVNYSTLMNSDFNSQFPNVRSYMMNLVNLDGKLSNLFDAATDGMSISISPTAENISCLNQMAVDRNITNSQKLRILYKGNTQLPTAQAILRTLSLPLQKKLVDNIVRVAVGIFNYDSSTAKIEELQRLVLLNPPTTNRVVFLAYLDDPKLLMFSNVRFTVKNTKDETAETGYGLYSNTSIPLLTATEIEKLKPYLEGNKGASQGTLLLSKTVMVSSSIGDFNVQVKVIMGERGPYADLKY